MKRIIIAVGICSLVTIANAANVECYQARPYNTTCIFTNLTVDKESDSHAFYCTISHAKGAWATNYHMKNSGFNPDGIITFGDADIEVPKMYELGKLNQVYFRAIKDADQSGPYRVDFSANDETGIIKCQPGTGGRALIAKDFG